MNVSVPEFTRCRMSALHVVSRRISFMDAAPLVPSECVAMCRMGKGMLVNWPRSNWVMKQQFSQQIL